jgi:hypothetical protein
MNQARGHYSPKAKKRGSWLTDNVASSAEGSWLLGLSKPGEKDIPQAESPKSKPAYEQALSRHSPSPEHSLVVSAVEVVRMASQRGC